MLNFQSATLNKQGIIYDYINMAFKTKEDVSLLLQCGEEGKKTWPSVPKWSRCVISV
jgi:hypothetical protein